MAKKQFYAVAVGKQPGIYKSWYEAEKQVNGFKGAIFRGFVYKSDAKAYMAENKPKAAHKATAAPEKTKSKGRWWLDPGYDKRLAGGAWNPEYT
jgi:viroplasmin and RNaseH domain-containing protein